MGANSFVGYPYLNPNQIRPSKNIFMAGDEDVDTYITYPPKFEDEVNPSIQSRNKASNTCLTSK